MVNLIPQTIPQAEITDFSAVVDDNGEYVVSGSNGGAALWQTIPAVQSTSGLAMILFNPETNDFIAWPVNAPPGYVLAQLIQVEQVT